MKLTAADLRDLTDDEIMRLCEVASEEEADRILVESGLLSRLLDETMRQEPMEWREWRQVLREL